MSAPSRVRTLAPGLPAEALGLPSFCTAHPGAIRALLAHAARRGLPVLIEATCNQVNQDGGYTGQKPAQFAGWLRGLAEAAGANLILGGDHLGPNPWRREPADVAMAKGEALVAAFAVAGVTKIHLDASMALGGEPQPDPATVAERAARLAAAAEGAAPHPARLSYVVGTEVPTPGGEAEGHALSVTTPAALRETLETHRAAFARRGLEAAFDKVAAVVVQPGVDFGPSEVAPYDPAAARALVAALPPGPFFEAHSTDYQPDEALAGLARDRFAILKVGPELTFAWREALVALDHVEAQLRPPGERTGAVEALRAEMRRDPSDWKGHYAPGGALPIEAALLFGLSDRARYYWGRPAVARAVERLIGGLPAGAVPRPLLRQYLPGLDARLPLGAPSPSAADILAGTVEAVADRYWRACLGHARAPGGNDSRM